MHCSSSARLLCWCFISLQVSLHDWASGTIVLMWIRLLARLWPAWVWLLTGHKSYRPALELELVGFCVKLTVPIVKCVGPSPFPPFLALSPSLMHACMHALSLASLSCAHPVPSHLSCTHLQSTQPFPSLLVFLSPPLLSRPLLYCICCSFAPLPPCICTIHLKQQGHLSLFYIAR